MVAPSALLELASRQLSRSLPRLPHSGLYAPGLASRRAAWMAWGARYRRSPTAFYLLLTIVSAGLALGGPYRFGNSSTGCQFNFIREPSRFTVLGVLGIAVLAGVGFDWLTARLAPSRRRLAAVVAGGLLVAEFSTIPFTAIRTGSRSPPPIGGWRGRPKPFSIAEVPAPGPERYHSNYMLHSMAHWQKTVHGFSGIRPALHDELYSATRELSRAKKAFGILRNSA